MPQFFNLQEGEQIIKEIKPLPNYRWYLFVTGFFTSAIFGSFMLFLLSLYLFRIMYDVSFSITNVIYFFITILTAFTVLSYITSHLAYKKRYYWITNKRIICKRGLIGYSISSIPFERVSDVIISRSFLERLFGFGSLQLQSLAGQLGIEGSLNAIPEPEKTQELIFSLIKRKRKEEKLTF